MTQLPIAPVGLVTSQQVHRAARPDVAADPPDFGQWLKNSLAEVNQVRNASDDAQKKLIVGESSDIHGTMIAMQKAGIAMDLVLEVRNKVIAAYDEIKRMQF